MSAELFMEYFTACVVLAGAGLAALLTLAVVVWALVTLFCHVFDRWI